MRVGVEAMRLQYLTCSHTGDFWKWVWANCRTGNTSQLAFLEDGVFRHGFEAYWAASRLCAVGVHHKRAALGPVLVATAAAEPRLPYCVCRWEHF